ncbi:hypothetical protein HDU99_000303 [Rhizoclosmatium hyalinum]|nr:hypothetical protein HDU99_000303 [Rhizoclosmatium hyalinum]
MQGIHDFQVLRTVHAPSGNGGTPFDDLASLPGGRTIVSVNRITGAFGLFWNTHAMTIQFFYILDNGEEWSPGPRGDAENLQYGAGFEITLSPGEIIESAKVLNADGQDLGGRIVSYVEFKIVNKPDGKTRTVDFGTKSSEFLECISLPGSIFACRGRAGMVIDSLQFYYL